MARIPLTLGKHYLLIDSPISFYLIDNEENSVYRPSGVWQLDTWKLLPEKYQKDHPVYTLSVEYDERKLTDGKEVLIRESDIDLGDGVAGVSGQAVMLTGINDSLLPVPVSVSKFPDVQNVNSCLRSTCGFPGGEPLSFSEFLSFIDKNKNICIDCLLFSIVGSSDEYLVLTWSLLNVSGKTAWVAVGRKFSDNSLAKLVCLSGSDNSAGFSPFYHVI